MGRLQEWNDQSLPKAVSITVDVRDMLPPQSVSGVFQIVVVWTPRNPTARAEPCDMQHAVRP